MLPHTSQVPVQASPRPAGIARRIATAVAAILALLGTFVAVGASPAHAIDGHLYRNYEVFNFAPFALHPYEHWQDTGWDANWWKQEPSSDTTLSISPGLSEPWSIYTPEPASKPHYYVHYTFSDTLNDTPTAPRGTQYELSVYEGGDWQLHCRVIRQSADPDPLNPFPAANDVSGNAAGPWTCGIGYEDYNATARDRDDPVPNATQTMVIDLLPATANRGTDASPVDWVGGTVPAAALGDVIGACAKAPTTTKYVPGDPTNPGATYLSPPPSSYTTKRTSCIANNAQHLGTGSIKIPFGGTASACPYGDDLTLSISDTRKVEATVTNEDSVTVGSELEFGDLTFTVAYARAFSRSYMAGAELSGAINLSAKPATKASLMWTRTADIAAADWVVQVGGVKYKISHAVGHFPTAPGLDAAAVSTNPDIAGFTTPPKVYVPDAAATAIGGGAGIPWGNFLSSAVPLSNDEYNSNSVGNKATCGGPAPYLYPRPDHTDTSGNSYAELPSAQIGAPYYYGFNGTDSRSSHLMAYGGNNVTFTVDSGALPPGLHLTAGPKDQYGRFTAVISGMATTQSFDSYSYYPFSIRATNDADPAQSDVVNYRIIPYANALPTTAVTPRVVPSPPTVGSTWSTKFQADGCCVFVDHGGSPVGKLPTFTIGDADAATLAAHHLLLDPDGTLHTLAGASVVGPGQFTVTLQVPNPENTAATTVQYGKSVAGMYQLPITITIPGAQITSAPINATVGVNKPYSFTPSAWVSPAPASWYVSGQTPLSPAPPGLTINAATGVLTGPITSRGDYTFTVCVFPNGGSSACQTEHLLVTEPPKFTSAAPGYGTVGTPFSAQVTATAYPPPAYSATGLPAGLSINASTGLISGTPTGSTSATVVVSATNSAGSTSQTFTLRIWQNSWQTIAASAWTGSAAAGAPLGRVTTLHASSPTVANRLSFTSDSATTDTAATSSTDTAVTISGASACPLGTGIGAMESVYYGGDNATASRSWRVNVDGPSGYLQTYVRAIDAQHPLSAAAQVGCVGTTDAAGNIGVRVLATEPGSTMLWWADAFPGTPSPLWTGLLAPPTIAALGYAGSSAGAIIGKPTITSRARGEYDLAVTGADGTAWLGHYTPATGWSGWQSLGGTATSAVSISTDGATSLRVFQRGTDGALYVDTMAGTTWSGWSRLAGPMLAANTGPAAIGFAAGKTDVLVLGSDSKVYRLHYS